jgi:cell division topological specificity factor
MIKNIINWLLGEKETSGSGNIAANRMKLMVVHDRYQMPPAVVEEMKSELLKVAAKYFDIDTESAECMIKSQGNRRAFISATVPLLNRGANNKDGNTNIKEKSSGKNKKNLSTSAA